MESNYIVVDILTFMDYWEPFTDERFRCQYLQTAEADRGAIEGNIRILSIRIYSSIK